MEAWAAMLEKEHPAQESKQNIKGIIAGVTIASPKSH
jgi:hypothetical protein